MGPYLRELIMKLKYNGKKREEVGARDMVKHRQTDLISWEKSQ